MADWDGLRRGLEDGVNPPPLSALRAKRQRREQRRVVAVTCALALVGTASGVALLGQRERPGGPPAQTAAIGTTADRVALGSRFVPEDRKDYVVTDVDFVDPANGWAIGLRCTGEQCDVATWHTPDGGATWDAPVTVANAVARTSFVQEDPRGGAARSLRMVDAKEGFAFNPDLYVTHDGARTWHRVPQPSKVASISVMEDSVWVVEHGCAAEEDCDVVVRAGTAGKAFALRDLRVPSTRGSTLVRRSSTYRGFLVSWGGDSPSLHLTDDGAKTWTTHPSPCAGTRPAALSGTEFRGMWLVCAAESESDGRKVTAAKQAYHSDDGGVTWQHVGDLPAEGELTDLVTVSRNTAYATTQLPARVLVTNDGGASWHPATGTARNGYGYGNLTVLDPRHAWAMGDAGVLWRTRDGATWERLALPPGAPRATASASPVPRGSAPAGDAGVTFTGVSFYDADHGYAIGRRCAKNLCHIVLRRTSDGGRNWVVAKAPGGTWREDDGTPQPVRVDAVTFADARNGWLYGQNLWTTHDGGAHWKEDQFGYTRGVEARGDTLWLMGYEGCLSQECGYYFAREPVTGAGPRKPVEGTSDGPDSTGMAHVSLSVVDELTAFVVDDGRYQTPDPIVQGTTDGGKTWHAHAGPCRSASYRQISASGPRDVWVACTGEDDVAAIAHSVDGGATWVTQRHDVPVDMLRAVSPLLVFAADRGGVSVTRDGGVTWRTQPGITSRGGPIDFAVLDGRHGFALFADGAFYRMTDGASWERMTRP